VDVGIAVFVDVNGSICVNVGIAVFVDEWQYLCECGNSSICEWQYLCECGNSSVCGCEWQLNTVIAVFVDVRGGGVGLFREEVCVWRVVCVGCGWWSSRKMWCVCVCVCVCCVCVCVCVCCVGVVGR